MRMRFEHAAAAVVLAMLIGGLPGCATEDEVVGDQVQNKDASFISSVVPKKAPPGARVRILGGDFGDMPGDKGMVKLLPGSGYQPVRLAVESWSDTLIYVRVPQVPSTANLDSRLQVTDSRGQIAYSAVAFEVEAAASGASKEGR
ncbi:MAG: hypothetical protein HY816_11270 [Candidatus Wallbacteria bacterium]|nr:hypothetical protein [Candidatus Wallbacteria bacterium]